MNRPHTSEVRHAPATCPAGSAVEGNAKLRCLLCLAVIGLAGSLMVVVATPWGIGLSPDSGVYIAGARSLVRGAGFSTPTEHGDFIPIVHFPPLYSLALTVPVVFGGDLLPGARWFSASVFACNVILAGALVWPYRGRLGSR